MECEILFNLRNSYYLGKHSQTLDLWKEYLADGDSLTEVQSKEVGVILQKSLLMMLKAYSDSDKEVDKSLFSKFKGTVNLYIEYLAPLEMTPDAEEIEQLHQKFIDDYSEKLDNSENIDYILINNYLSIGSGMLSHIKPIDKKYKSAYIEFLLISIETYLQNNQLKEAKNNLQKLKTFASDDDIVYEFAQISIGLYSKEFEECLGRIQEIRGKFEDSAKLHNLTACCYLGKRDFSKAETVLKTVHKYLHDNEDQINLHEYEQCLRNLIVVSTILGRGQEVIGEYLKELNDKTDGNDPIIKKMTSYQE